MHQRLMDCIAQGDIEVICLCEEGDGAKEVMLYKRPVLKVLRELIGDERLAGCQHFAFVLYKDENGERILACDANGSLTFQMAQERIGPGKVPISTGPSCCTLTGLSSSGAFPSDPYTVSYITWYIPWYI